MPQNTYYCDFIHNVTTCLESIYECAFCNDIQQCGNYNNNIFTSSNGTYDCTNITMSNYDQNCDNSKSWISYLFTGIGFGVILLVVFATLFYGILRHYKEFKILCQITRDNKTKNKKDETNDIDEDKTEGALTHNEEII